MKKRISFDFDGCLNDCTQVQELAKIYSVIEKIDVYILTSRRVEDKHIIESKIQELNLKVKEIIFAPRIPKSEKIKEYNISVHYDDDEIDIKQINEETNASAFLVNLRW